MSGELQIGDPVLTPLGPGLLVSVWHEMTWAFGIPRQRAFWVVQLDDGAGQWRSIFKPADVQPLEEATHEAK